jgi:hypothetical protein
LGKLALERNLKQFRLSALPRCAFTAYSIVLQASIFCQANCCLRKKAFVSLQYVGVMLSYTNVLSLPLLPRRFWVFLSLREHWFVALSGQQWLFACLV